MARTKIPPIASWYAYLASCGFETIDRPNFRAKVHEGAKLGREIPVTVKNAEGGLEYRYITYDVGQFRLRKPSDEEARSIRLNKFRQISAQIARRKTQKTPGSHDPGT